jgi:hypothetical protein
VHRRGPYSATGGIATLDIPRPSAGDQPGVTLLSALAGSTCVPAQQPAKTMIMISDREAMDDATRLYDAVNSVDISRTLELLLREPSSVVGLIHENGFHKLTLMATRLAPALRVHLWLADRHYGKVPGNIHNHRWCFASKILAGSITTASFVASSDAGQTYEHCLYDPYADPEMLYVGSVRLKRQDVETFHVGQCYYLDSRIIHQAEPLMGQPTVTLIARSEPQRKAADVYAAERPRGLPGASVRLSEAQVLRDLQYVYELISAGVGNTRCSP